MLVEVARRAIELGRVDEAADLARQRARRMLSPVINATGVLLHTNLGRAPLAVETAATYTNLELDLLTGRRGSRQTGIGELLASACGAEAAMVVNNCAGAVLLTLAALAQGRGVAVGRGEMVEIGGGFRIPDVMNQSGARLVEVGTTNRSRLSDYVDASTTDALSGPAAAGAFRSADPTTELAMVLKVHRSNYRIVGFTQDVSVRELAASPDISVPIVADIGSGLLDRACPWLDGPPPSWLADEPAVRQTLADGADLVLFSGDKLFGGPQAGIIAGRRDLVEQCGRHPLARALRPGALVMHALQQTTLAYLDRRGDDIPLWRMVATGVDDLERRAEAILADVEASSSTSEKVHTGPTRAVPGGGTLPTVTLPSHGLLVEGDATADLRSRDRPIVARVEDATTIIDLRTVDPADDAELTAALTTNESP